MFGFTIGFVKPIYIPKKKNRLASYPLSNGERVVVKKKKGKSKKEIRAELEESINAGNVKTYDDIIEVGAAEDEVVDSLREEGSDLIELPASTRVSVGDTVDLEVGVEVGAFPEVEEEEEGVDSGDGGLVELEVVEDVVVDSVFAGEVLEVVKGDSLVVLEVEEVVADSSVVDSAGEVVAEGEGSVDGGKPALRQMKKESKKELRDFIRIEKETLKRDAKRTRDKLRNKAHEGVRKFKGVLKEGVF